MQYKKFKNTYIVRVERGEEAIKQLTELCKKENITLGSISAIGATNRAELLWYDPDKKEYSEKTYEGDKFEIASFVGSTTQKGGEPYLHCHITLGDKNFQTFAGHCKSVLVSGAFEVVIESIDGKVEREHSEEIGLNLLKFE